MQSRATGPGGPPALGIGAFASGDNPSSNDTSETAIPPGRQLQGGGRPRSRSSADAEDEDEDPQARNDIFASIKKMQVRPGARRAASVAAKVAEQVGCSAAWRAPQVASRAVRPVTSSAVEVLFRGVRAGPHDWRGSVRQGGGVHAAVDRGPFRGQGRGHARHEPQEPARSAERSARPLAALPPEHRPGEGAAHSGSFACRPLFLATLPRTSPTASSFDSPQYIEAFFEDGTLYIVMELCEEGDLTSFIKKRRGHLLPEDDVMRIFVQICLGLAHTHSEGVLHRDMKPSNILLSKGSIVKLADFGIARVMSGKEKLAKTVVGTPYYLSPEICEDRPYGVSSDMWSLGCVLYELCALKRPFEGTSFPSLIVRILNGKYPPIPSSYSEDLHGVIEALLQRDPDARPTLDDILVRVEWMGRVSGVRHLFGCIG